MIYIVTHTKMKLKYYSRKSETVNIINIETGKSNLYEINEITDKEKEIVNSITNQQIYNSDLLIIGFDNNKVVALIILQMVPLKNDVKISFFHCIDDYLNELLTRLIKYITNMGYYNLLVHNSVFSDKDILINYKFDEHGQYMIRSCNIKGPSSRL